jgi:hypothetical protein
VVQRAYGVHAYGAYPILSRVGCPPLPVKSKRAETLRETPWHATIMVAWFSYFSAASTPWQLHETPDSTMRQVGHPPEAPKVFCFSQSDEWVDLDTATGGGAVGERGERASLLQRQ